MLSLEEVGNFHPLYKMFINAGFDFYGYQTFIRTSDNCKIELSLLSNLFCTPELASNSYRFVDRETKQNLIDNKMYKVKNLIVNLNMIEVDKNTRKNGKGTELMEWFISCVDKFDYEISLDIDEQFGVPCDKLRKWYQRFGYIEKSQGKMIRPKKSDFMHEINTLKFMDIVQLSEWITNMLERVEETMKDYINDEECESEEIESYSKTINYLKCLKLRYNNIVNIIGNYNIMKNVCYDLLYVLKEVDRYAELYFDECNDKLRCCIDRIENSIKAC